jgi:hypothetical protein
MNVILTKQGGFIVKKFLLLAIFVALIFGECAAEDLFPAPCINGATGIVRMPSADVLPYRNFNVGFDYGINSETNNQILFYKMNLGTFQGLELGIVGGTSNGEGAPREGVFINMKYSLAAGSYDNPLFLAIGVENLSSYHQTDVYMVATRSFQDGPRLHFGFMGDFPGEKFRPLGMLGFDFPLWENFLVMFDTLAGETIFQLDAGIRWYLSPTTVLNISALNITYTEDSTQQFKDPKSILIGLAFTNPF